MTRFKNQQVIAELTGITRDLSIVNSGFIFREKEHPFSEHTPLTVLTNFLYSNCYALKLSHQKGEGLPAESTDSDGFQQELSTHNFGKEHMEPGWTVQSTHQNGFAEVVRGNQLRQVPVAHLRGASSSTPTHEQGTVAVLFPHEQKAEGQGFYYAFSNLPADMEQNLLRVYWNLRPEGAKELLSWVTSTLNSYRIPFVFKCLNHAHLYVRRDAAVLYLEEHNSELVKLLLPDAIRAVDPYLEDDVPLFAHPMARGVGLAESPGRHGSFGMHRMQLVAEVILKDPTVLESSERFISEVAEAFLRQGLDPAKPYLNKGSLYLTL